MNDLRVELGIPSQSPFDIDTARKGGYVPLNPYSPTLPPFTGTVSLSSWYSFCQSCTPIYSHTVYYISPHANYECFATRDDACNHSPANSIIMYSSSSIIVAGSTLYILDNGIYYPVNFSTNGGNNLWLWDDTGNQPILMSDNGGFTSNIVDLVSACL